MSIGIILIYKNFYKTRFPDHLGNLGVYGAAAMERMLHKDSYAGRKLDTSTKEIRRTVWSCGAYLFFHFCDLGDPAAVAFATGKLRGQPGIYDLQGQGFTGDECTQGHHVGVVVLAGQPCAHQVMQQGAANPGNLVGCDGNADAGGAKDDAPVTFPVGDSPGSSSGKVGIIAGIQCIGAEVGHLMALLLQMDNNGIFQRQSATELLR